MRIVVDIGNSRVKWGVATDSTRVRAVESHAFESLANWPERAPSLERLADPSSTWAISSVNPPAAETLQRYLHERGVERVHWYRRAAEVDLPHALAAPETTGADRALAVRAAMRRQPSERPGIVVLCGTAVVVESISAEGVWLGGAIAAGLGLTARALHLLTAQLPLVSPRVAPPPLGNATRPALEAGVYWGTVGAIRELVRRRNEAFGTPGWVVWTGGDADVLAAGVAWPDSEILPDLVLEGLAGAAFPSRDPARVDQA